MKKVIKYSLSTLMLSSLSIATPLLITSCNQGPKSYYDYVSSEKVITNNLKSLLTETMQKFDISQIFPNIFKKEKFALNKTNIDYDYANNFIGEGNIQTYYAGNQLREYFKIIDDINDILDQTSLIYQTTNRAGDLWNQAYKNDKESKANFETTIKTKTKGNIDYKIELNDNDLLILVKHNDCYVEIKRDISTWQIETRIQINTSSALKIITNNESIEIGLRKENDSRVYMKFDTSQLNHTIGTIYNLFSNDYKVDYIDGNGSAGNFMGFRTVSTIDITDSYLILMGKKGDFNNLTVNNRNIEMYDVITGKFIMGKTIEWNNNDKIVYNYYPVTSIYNLYNIKIIDPKNYQEERKVYLNQWEKQFIEVTTNNIKMYEFKLRRVQIVNKDATTNQYNYLNVRVPFLFMEDSFEKNSRLGFYELNRVNKYLLKQYLDNKTSKIDKKILEVKLNNLLDLYDSFITNDSSYITQKNLNNKTTNFIGDNNSWFNVELNNDDANFI